MVHYYKFNIPDWVLHTSHLTPEEEGIYLRLLNHFYDTEQAISEEIQSVIRRLRLTEYEEKVTAILEEFFRLERGVWTHKRCEKEIFAFHAKADANKENGRKGGRPKVSKHKHTPKEKPKITQSVISGNPNITLTKNHKPLTTNQEPSTPKVDNVRFDEFYSAYPRKAAKAQALKAWQKLKPDDILINRILKDITQRLDSGEFDIDDKTHIPHPATYLNGQRWEDEIIPRGVPHETHQHSGGGQRLSAVDRVRRHGEELDRQIAAAEAEETAADGVGPAGGDVWPSVDQSVWGDDAGDVDPAFEGILVN